MPGYFTMLPRRSSQHLSGDSGFTLGQTLIAVSLMGIGIAGFQWTQGGSSVAREGSVSVPLVASQEAAVANARQIATIAAAASSAGVKFSSVDDALVRLGAGVKAPGDTSVAGIVFKVPGLTGDMAQQAKQHLTYDSGIQSPVFSK